jgi:ferredoxin
MAKLFFENTQEEIEVEDGSEIQPVCEEAGIPFACTEGICGTCIVEITEGMDNLSDFTEAEEDFLGEMETERMACQCRIKQGTVKIKF